MSSPAHVDVESRYSAANVALARATAIDHDRHGRRNELRLLDACLHRLEDAQERGERQVSRDLAKSLAVLVDGVVEGMTLSEAVDVVFRDQERLQSGLRAPRRFGADMASLRSFGRRSLNPVVQASAKEGREAGSNGEGSFESSTALVTPPEARRLTEQIKAGMHGVSVLLLEAHDRRAWSALGYGSWANYAHAEFRLSRSRSYELLDHGRVLRSLAAAAGLSGIPDISPYAAAQIKPDLDRLTQEIRVRAVGLPEVEALDLVLALVETARATTTRCEPSQITINDVGRSGVTRQTVESHEITQLIAAVELLAALPRAEIVARCVSPEQATRLTTLRAAARWLTAFASQWAKANHEGDERVRGQHGLTGL